MKYFGLFDFIYFKITIFNRTNNYIVNMNALIRKFCNKRDLSRKYPSLKVHKNPETNQEFVHIDDLMLIVRFLGFLKFEYNRPNSRNHIFMRGQVDNFGIMTPSLFRGKNLTKETIQLRYEAYKRVGEKLFEITRRTPARFKGEIGGAALQHYGLKTPWLDLVDNIFIALWFARNEMNWIKDDLCEITKSTKEFGWIYLLKADYEKEVNDEGIYNGETTKWCDLRYHHRDLSLRPHFQHGIFIAKTNPLENNTDLDDEIIAVIRFPVNFSVSLKNDIEDVTAKHIFPNKTYDHTYKYLTNPRVNKMIESVEHEFNLGNRELGRIFTVANNY